MWRRKHVRIVESPAIAVQVVKGNIGGSSIVKFATSSKEVELRVERCFVEVINFLKLHKTFISIELFLGFLSGFRTSELSPTRFKKKRQGAVEEYKAVLVKDLLLSASTISFLIESNLVIEFILLKKKPFAIFL